MTQDLFYDFPPSSKEAWKNQAAKDLRGQDFDQALKSLLWEKIQIQPFYTREDVLDLPRLPENSFEDKPFLQDFSARSWSNFLAVYPSTPIQEIMDFLENGGEGLVLHLKGDENLNELLKDVIPDYISIMLKPLGDPAQVLEHFMTWVHEMGVEESGLTGGLLWSPIDMLFEQGKSWEEAISAFRRVFSCFPNERCFHACMFNFSRYADAGASGLDELIFGFGEIIELIDKSGIDPITIFEKSGFYTSVGDLHFPEIAKLKTIRFFYAELALQYNVELRLENTCIFAQTSGWSKSTLDSNTNLIRQTYEAMASILGGANGLWVRPISGQKATELELRVARNVSFILNYESYFGKVGDPAAGSYYLDTLITQLMDEVKSGLQELEKNGGWLVAFESRMLHKKIREHRQKQQNSILSGEISKIGVNKYPASDSLKNNLEFSPILEKEYELKPSRASYLVELQNQTGA
ncbi:methylmalonyl-CoA mutase family protein [Algoriphagus sp.]|uniref:methylmalonyl-CoA mutase family protein n=1 Tax=Algoriphagus sp. TaxID=1872435 RepID=UPI00272858AC|nr:methylmalonyl-CoA mutase family protein [Algoriphagus sp.]MDO8967101.1 methylmalonyl-CoA mutase family protein [Algoriphagus sp.]MDP3199405.1 methylmalonyl-CoA mutase family protein [Algoriphagus sp.]